MLEKFKSCKKLQNILYHFFYTLLLFSGTLHPNCQDSNGRPRRDIGTILQILNDLLSATRHYQGMPPSLTQLRYQTQCGSPTSPSPSPPPSPAVAGMTGLSPKATSVPAGSPPPSLHPLVQCQSQIRMCKPPGELAFSSHLLRLSMSKTEELTHAPPNTQSHSYTESLLVSWCPNGLMKQVFLHLALL